MLFHHEYCCHMLSIWSRNVESPLSSICKTSDMEQFEILNSSDSGHPDGEWGEIVKCWVFARLVGLLWLPLAGPFRKLDILRGLLLNQEEAGCHNFLRPILLNYKPMRILTNLYHFRWTLTYFLNDNAYEEYKLFSYRFCNFCSFKMLS